MTTIDPTSPPSALDTSIRSATSTVTKGLGKDAFLQLLVASMRYQDPSKPTDSQQYMAQLAQFTQVEKLDAISSSQADASRWQRTVAGQGMLGCTVTGKGPAGEDVTGVVVGVTLTSTGARVQLSDGRSLAVDEVTKVDVPGLARTNGSTAAAATATASPPTSATTSGTTTAGGTTPPAQSAPPPAAPATSSEPPASPEPTSPPPPPA